MYQVRMICSYFVPFRDARVFPTMFPIDLSTDSRPIYLPIPDVPRTFLERFPIVFRPVPPRSPIVPPNPDHVPDRFPDVFPTRAPIMFRPAKSPFLVLSHTAKKTPGISVPSRQPMASHLPVPFPSRGK